jgi:hypothetical protein
MKTTYYPEKMPTMTSNQKFKQLLTPMGKLAIIIACLLPVIPKQETAHAVNYTKTLFSSDTKNSDYTTGALSKWLHEFGCDENPQIGNPVTGVPGAFYGPPRGGGGNSTAQAHSTLSTGLKGVAIYVGDPKAPKGRVDNFKGMVEFDGIRCYPDGSIVLQDAKRSGAKNPKKPFYNVCLTNNNDKWFTLRYKIPSIIRQIMNQLRAAEKIGASVVWPMNNWEEANCIQNLLNEFAEHSEEITLALKESVEKAEKKQEQALRDLQAVGGENAPEALKKAAKSSTARVAERKSTYAAWNANVKGLQEEGYLEKAQKNIKFVGSPISEEELAFGNSLVSAESRRETYGSAPGGIDFSTLELRYIAEDSGLFADRGLKYAFNGVPAVGNKNLKAGRIASAQASDAFFVWLALSPDKFWVNLNPNEPDRIIDPQLGKTDVGRILLQSDFQMKKIIVKLRNPDTPLGRQFFQQQEKIGFNICPPVMRYWIVPAPATVREDDNGIYIVDAPLDVKLEALDEKFSLPSSLPKGFAQASCSMPDRSTKAKIEAMERELTLPHVVKAVNNAPEYAELRRVYRSRVAAEWYRQRSATKETAYRSLINKGDISSWTAAKDWLPKQVFNQYVNSLKKVEYQQVVNSDTWREGNWIYTQKQIYVVRGGVDFTRVFFKQLSSVDFKDKWGNLQQVVDTSMKSPVSDQSGKIWLGGRTTTGKAIWKSLWFYFGLGFLAMPFLIHGKRL